MTLGELLAGDAIDVAPRLLGWRLTSTVERQLTEVTISEVEAYGPDDPASHAYRGKTPTNSPMFEAAGRWYVYRSYGIHWCVNLVTGSPGSPQAVLIRAGIPSAGIDVMAERRGRLTNLTTGPGNLTKALAIGPEHNRSPVGRGPITLLPPVADQGTVRSGPRIGISRAMDRPWRFWTS